MTKICVEIRILMPWGHLAGRWHGNRRVRPLLALHGWLDNMGTWNNLLPLLPAHVGVLCIDLPGHGRSSKLPPGIVYHSVDYVCVIQRIMQEYNWQKVSLLTHSMSSVFSLLFSALYPHRVDLLICVDIVSTRQREPDLQIAILNGLIEKYLIEDERLAQASQMEPPCYTYAELEQLQYTGSNKSVDLANCTHILERNVAKSNKFPDKYYFSRDGRVKYYFELTTSLSFAAALTRCLCSVPYCVIKGSESPFINEQKAEVIAILREHNPHFELHEVRGTHHVHLNNAAEVAAVLNPFICKYRPPLLETWSLSDELAESKAASRARNPRRWTWGGQWRKQISKL